MHIHRGWQMLRCHRCCCCCCCRPFRNWRGYLMDRLRFYGRRAARENSPVDHGTSLVYRCFFLLGNKSESVCLKIHILFLLWKQNTSIRRKCVVDWWKLLLVGIHKYWIVFRFFSSLSRFTRRFSKWWFYFKLIYFYYKRASVEQFLLCLRYVQLFEICRKAF